MALGNLGFDKARFRLCVAVQMTSLGMPVIYYGEEVARGGTQWPLNRNDMPWGARDIGPGKGIARDEAMRAWYKSLIGIRRARPALTRGDYTLLTRPDDRVLAYARHDAASGDRVLVLANRDDAPLAVDVVLPSGWPPGPATDLLQSAPVTTEEGRLRVTLEPKSVRIVVPAGAPGAR
jgi:alpha-amylase